MSLNRTSPFMPFHTPGGHWDRYLLEMRVGHADRLGGAGTRMDPACATGPFWKLLDLAAHSEHLCEDTTSFSPRTAFLPLSFAF